MCNRIAGEGRIITSYGAVCYHCITMIEDIANEVNEDEMPEMQQTTNTPRIPSPYLGKINVQNCKQ